MQRRKMLRRATLRRALAAAFAGAFLAAAVPAALEAAPKKGGTLVYANTSGPGTLDPQVSASMVDLEVVHHMYEGLVTIDETYATKPLLATSIDVAPDGKTFTFKLRKGVKFHSGQELTSADVKATFERYAKVSPNASALAEVESYETPDPYTFVVKLKTTNSVFVDVLKTPVYPFVILPADQKDKPARGIDAVGTGPYKLGEWMKDSHLVINRFDGYVADERKGPDGFAGARTAYLDSIRYNFVPEANARIAALQTGEADFAALIPPDLMKRLESSPDIEVSTVFPYCQQYFIVHSQQAPTDNPLVRQAIRSVVAVDEIIAVTGGGARRNHSMVYPDGEYYGGKVTEGRYDNNDPEKAKALLKEAGYKGEKIVLQSNTSYGYMRDAVLVLAEQMKAAGMNVDVDIVDWTTNASNMQKGTGGWNVSTTGFCSNPLLGPQQWKTMIYNFPHVKDDKVLDDAYAKFFSSLDLKDRKDAWLDIEQRVLDQAYMIKVSDRGAVKAYNKTKFGGVRPYYMTNFWDVYRK
ncbi:MAG: ABC transporter substrate-binding protein [Thalassobaculum sp.]|uniref:ABC transporter substrate-binding protein n=1 Tax=Thalassobaculum sp. TaxID=2022740 RepID=UPI0032EB7397